MEQYDIMGNVRIHSLAESGDEKSNTTLPIKYKVTASSLV